MVEECKKTGILRESPIELPTSFSWFTNGHFEPIIRSLSPKTISIVIGHHKELVRKVT